ncbi:hypothetical protein, partial [Paenibacillus sp. VTT E-133291]|uniref:hypothetical protein n=1 Tax=Paenibacillus sp. VTT E-133291 TaxID=1986223 RepID=UPI001C52807A
DGKRLCEKYKNNVKREPYTFYILKNAGDSHCSSLCTPQAKIPNKQRNENGFIIYSKKKIPPS